MNEKLKNFLLYGIENKIERKQIYKMDVLILFFSIFMFVLSEDFKIGQIICALLVGTFIISTFSSKDIEGRKIFLIYGIWSLGFSLLFGIFGTILMLSTIKQIYYVEYLVVLGVLYVIMIMIFLFSIIYLIKKNTYEAVPVKKMAGGWCFLLLGKKAAKIKSGSGVPNKTKVATITKAQVEEIAKTKMPDLNAANLESATEMIKGTARSMGVTVEE